MCYRSGLWSINSMHVVRGSGCVGTQVYLIRRNNAIKGYCTVQGHLIIDFDTNWKLICDFLLVINTNYLISCTVSKLRLIICQVTFSLATRVGSLHFNAIAGVVPCEYLDNITSPETRIMFLPDTEGRTMVFSFVGTKHRNVTDGRTDRQQ